MADNEKQPLKGGAAAGNKDAGENKDEKEEEVDEGCCSKFGSCLVAVFSTLYKMTTVCCRYTRDCLAIMWYPCKERCSNCIDDCDKKINPWKDPSYSHV